MAMAGPAYSSTEETTNACRACRLLLGPCTDQLRDVLLHHVPPSTFPHVIKQKISYLPRLTTPQMNLILPRGSSYTGTYCDFDISLLYILLRNICGIPPHSKGWGNSPDLTDKSLSANIERIRIARNQCVHSSGPELSNADFNNIWSTVRSAVVDLDSCLSNLNKYEKEVDFLRHETMDPVRDRHFIEELRKQSEEDSATRELLNRLKCKLEESERERTENQNKMLKIVYDIKTPKSVIPPNVKDLHDKESMQWKEEDCLYSETHNFDAMLQKVRNKPYMTFVGVPGSGKSATIHHIALILQKEGSEVVPILDIKKIEDYCDSRNPQVFVIDDVVGVLGLQKQKLDTLIDYEKRILDPAHRNTKVLMSCRAIVFKECYKSFFVNDKNVVKMDSSENALNEDDKKAILQKHGLDRDLLSPTLLKETSNMFPLLCKLYSKEETFRKDAERFFTCPVQCILGEIDRMQQENNLLYATLVLCMFNEKLSFEILKDTGNSAFCEMKAKVLENCEVENNTDTFKFLKALSVMEGTYTKSLSCEYTLTHDSLFEIVAYHFGCLFPSLILQYSSSSYIANNVKVQVSKNEFENDYEEVKESVNVDDELNELNIVETISSESGFIRESFDLCILLREDQYSNLADRLYTDIEKMELYDVFMNDVLKQSKVCQTFIEILMKKSYKALKSLFLSEQKDICKIKSHRKRLRDNMWARTEWSKEQHRQDVLVNKGRTNGTYSVRVISWVIYYGHDRILKYIIKQTEAHNETHSELFWSSFPPKTSHETEKGNKNVDKNHATYKQDSIPSEKDRLFLLSCYSGDLETFKVVKKYMNTVLINRAFEFYDTPLVAACQLGHLSIVNELIKSGADVNLQSNDETPLTVACSEGHVSVVRKLLEAEADVNLYCRNDTPLAEACNGGYIDIVKMLLMAKANVDPLSVSNTPLIAACNKGDINIVKELIKAGADVNRKGECHTPLTAACKSGHLCIVKELIENGADVNLQSRISYKIESLKARHFRIYVDMQQAGTYGSLAGEGNTPLIEAITTGHMNIANELLKTKVKVNIRGRDETALTAACKGGHLSLIKELLDLGADVNLQSRDDTPLRIACDAGNINLVKELIEEGADVNQQCIYESPLIAACDRGNMDIVEELLQARAEVNMQEPDGRTPLYILIYNKTQNLNPAVEFLYNHGADPTISEKEGLSAMCIALIQNKIEIVKQLLRTGNKIQMKKLKLHLCKCLVNIRGCDVFTDSKDDVAMTQNRLGANQMIRVEHIDSRYGHDVKPLLFVMIDEKSIENKVEKVTILLKAGADVNLRVKYTENDSVLDREGVSVLERTRRLVGKEQGLEYKRVLSELKQHVRRYSV
ncbi:uncharacterized protein LOC134245848 [Saccostrea cucullata]|uniref:uncharacterized protein LOC134245848 n=1 Tax=Saccostrea cuccullata TaxID=36930 RepID=UPI002ED1252A